MEVTATAVAAASSVSNSTNNDDFDFFPIYAAEAMNPSRRSTMEDCYSILRPGTWNETIPDLSKSILEYTVLRNCHLHEIAIYLCWFVPWLTPCSFLDDEKTTYSIYWLVRWTRGARFGRIYPTRHALSRGTGIGYHGG
eukprot:scaffold184_cov179-Amphora_coffeaeformis.AAC.23